MQRGYLRFNDDVHQVEGDYVPLTSKDFGVFVTGTGTYNAPSRDVSFVAIPGRSQDIVRDNGRFNNITITYPCFIYSLSQTDFNDKLERFRNYVKKFTGWVKLQDSYHSDEYRMVSTEAEFTVEVTPDHRAGEFQLTLTAQPFRFLVSGDDIVTMANPTVYSGASTRQWDIVNDTDFSADGDFYFRRNGTGVKGDFYLYNNRDGYNTRTIVSFGALAAGGMQYCKYDAKSGLFLNATENGSSIAYNEKEYSIIAEDISITTSAGVSSVLNIKSGANTATLTVTGGTANQSYIMFISYVPHWRKL